MQASTPAIQLLDKVMKKQGWIDLPAKGTSMFPFIREGDICRFAHCKPSSLHKGDIVLYRTPFGQLVAHRLYDAKCVGGRKMFILKGDTNLRCDDPVDSEEIFGKLVYVKRNQLQIYPTNLQAYIWSKIILAIPVLSRILRIYLDRKGSSS